MPDEEPEKMSIISPRSTERDAGVDPASFGTRTGATELGGITGPVPVVDLDDGHVHVARRRDVTIVQLDGGLDDARAESIVGALRRVVDGCAAVVVDLDHVTLLDRSALDSVCAVLDELPPEVGRCLVAGRLSGRLVLDRWAVPSRFVVFTSVADALQAREFLASGYGDGWSTGS